LDLPISVILKRCPDIADYARSEIAEWRDLIPAASVARAALGVSPSAWEAAQSVLGERKAAVVIAYILQRGPAISSAGGYLRALTRKATTNGFAVAPMLMSLAPPRRDLKHREDVGAKASRDLCL
jgi:replication initiation protein RepC